MPIPTDYEPRVYAGILGKIIGVYLGRPFEGWSHRRILDELGEVNDYVHGRLGKDLVVADDDISGTFTFLRALEDHGISRDITPEQIGKTWLNYLIEKRTILWWGGMGTSTEHTAFLRLKHGVPAPRSGSIDLNGRIVAEQIGAQIFIDGWAMVAPGEPELAAELAKKAGSVSHDGEALYGAQALAVMESAAFYESDIGTLLDTALSFIPNGCTIARLIHDIRSWHTQDGDWKKTFSRIEQIYGYSAYGGGCHMIPNHAIIILALLYGEDDFQKSLMIANTAGWDTDCNSGNVGCLIGIKNGLESLNTGPDWRGPVADRLFKISADGADALTDAVRETYRICRIGRALLGEAPVPPPKNGARYHFSLPGSVQGFLSNPDGGASIQNSDGTLEITLDRIALGRPTHVGVQTFGEPADLNRPGYHIVMSPSLYPGQLVRANVHLSEQASGPVNVALYFQTYPEAQDQPGRIHHGPLRTLEPRQHATLEWWVPDTNGLPILRTGLSITSNRTTSGTLYLDSLTWSGAPTCNLSGPAIAALGKPLGWTDGVDTIRLSATGQSTRLELIQNEGRGLLLTGAQDWTDYHFSATVSVHMAAEAGIAIRAGGMKRFYALLLCPDHKIRLLKCRDSDTVLGETNFSWEPDAPYRLSLTAKGDYLTAKIDETSLFTLQDTDLPHGAIALVNTVGRSAFSEVHIEGINLLST
ncbi:MAG: ADP-ribosylglycohydrolase family protein [bacterium]|nr:ADP-ribosylglycohydrolase family protein [bacterium]